MIVADGILRRAWLGAAALALGVAPLPAQAQWRSALECERLASSPFDPDRPQDIAGVAADAIVLPEAVTACASASSEAPQNPRYHFNLARALSAAKRYQEAHDHYLLVTGPLQGLASNNLGNLFEDGKIGGKPDLGRAFAHYEVAAAQGGAVGAYNLARFLRAGLHGHVDKSRALVLLEEAVRRGFAPAMAEAAEMLEMGEGLASPSIERAAVYWRKLADGGNAQMAAKLGLAMTAGKVPGSSAEIETYLGAGLAGGHPDAGTALAGYLAERQPAAEMRPKALRAAVRALLVSRDAPAGSDAAWLYHQRLAGAMILKLAGDGAVEGLSADEMKAVRADFGSSQVRGFTVPMTCGGVGTRQQVYVWHWQRERPPTDPQFEWLEKRGCAVPGVVVESFRKLFSIAKENNVDFAELAHYALVEGGKEEKQEKKDNSGTATKQAEPVTGSGGAPRAQEPPQVAQSREAPRPAPPSSSDPDDAPLSEADRELAKQIANPMFDAQIERVMEFLLLTDSMKKFFSDKRVFRELVAYSIVANLANKKFIPKFSYKTFTFDNYTDDHAQAIRSRGTCLLEATMEVVDTEYSRFKKEGKQPNLRILGFGVARTAADAATSIGTLIAEALDHGEKRGLCPPLSSTDRQRRDLPRLAACAEAVDTFLAENAADVRSAYILISIAPEKRDAVMKNYAKPLARLCHSWRKTGKIYHGNQCSSIETPAIGLLRPLEAAFAACPKR